MSNNNHDNNKNSSDKDNNDDNDNNSYISFQIKVDYLIFLHHHQMLTFLEYNYNP